MKLDKNSKLYAAKTHTASDIRSHGLEVAKSYQNFFSASMEDDPIDLIDKDFLWMRF